MFAHTPLKRGMILELSSIAETLTETRNKLRQMEPFPESAISTSALNASIL